MTRRVQVLIVAALAALMSSAVHAQDKVTSDAGTIDADRFARGEEVVSSTGQKVRLARPLDWLAVSDHSDAMGVVADLIAGKPELMRDPTLRKWNQMTNAGPEEAMKAVMEMITLQGQGKLPKAMTDPNTLRSPRPAGRPSTRSNTASSSATRSP